jgi:hypothetical protein
MMLINMAAITSEVSCIKQMQEAIDNQRAIIHWI